MINVSYYTLFKKSVFITVIVKFKYVLILLNKKLLQTHKFMFFNYYVYRR